ncbi:MAG: hypothetical protein L0241_30755 [Planctomycetia bacterium]|nr:hypothetical protein [Planctomycetia bacterium]
MNHRRELERLLEKLAKLEAEQPSVRINWDALATGNRQAFVDSLPAEDRAIGERMFAPPQRSTSPVEQKIAAVEARATQSSS